MSKDLIKELQVANLLKAIELAGDDLDIEERKKVLDHIYQTEIVGLQYNIALFPPKQLKTQKYNFNERGER